MMASHYAQASDHTMKPEMPDGRTDDIRAFFGHVDQVATRSRRKFNSIYDTFLKKKKYIRGNDMRDPFHEYVPGPRCLQHG